MEPDKIAKFYSILFAYRGRICKRTCENEVYRENKIYSLWIEFGEKFDQIWQTLVNLIYNFSPLRSPILTLERLVSKVAFCPPKDTYVFNFDFNDSTDRRSRTNDTGELLLAQYATSIRTTLKNLYEKKLKDVIKHAECFYAFSKYGNRIACMLIHGPAKSRKELRNSVVVYSHTNAEDIGSSFTYLWRLRRNLQMPIFTYDYSGYGMSSGAPSERNLYADIEAAVQELTRRYDYELKNIILFGESIGSVPTVFMASQAEVKGVILQSSFMSGLRIYFPYDGSTLLMDPFPNIERIPLIKSKTLIIHGSEDQLVDISHAIKMHRLLKNAVTPFWANGRSHMTIHKHARYYDRLKYFIYFELSNDDTKG